MMDISPDLVTPELTAQVERVRVPADPPDDFARFWRQVADDLQRIPLNIRIQPAPGPGGGTEPSGEKGQLTYSVWSADSLDGRRIAGPLIFPADTQSPAPVWVYGHGYGSIKKGSRWRPDLARLGFIALGLDARGYNRSRLPDDPDVPGWILHGIESVETYILRGAVADTMRAVQVARALKQADPQRTVLNGASFSGGLAVLTAPWVQNLRYVAVAVPTFGAYDLRRTLVQRGSGHELNTYTNALPDPKARALRERLRYFDAVNAATFLRDIPVTVGLGVSDVVVPGETVAAIYHALATPDKQLLSYPCSHSTHPLAARWQAFNEHIQRRGARLCGLDAE